MAEWRKIDSAPKDGTRILLFNIRGIFLAHWDHEFDPYGLFDEAQDCYIDRPAWTDNTVKSFGYEEINEITDPTHWMPLPEVPE